MNQQTEKNSSQHTTAYHLPVMLEECMDGLNIRPEGVYVDVTFGGGGHSKAILSRLNEDGRLYAFDQDADAAANAIDDPRFRLIRENFKYMKSFLRLEGVRRVDGVLADLGVSSHQFDAAERGFSTRMDGPLDLRMDRRQENTAADIVNNAPEEELQRLMALYGELPNARSVARAIVTSRNKESIETTMQLRHAVEHTLPRNYENKYLAMIFQALRIEVNGELEALRMMLEQATELLVSGGRLCVMSYHSLEDRIVKNYIKSGNIDGIIEKDFFGNPNVPLRAVAHKAIRPTEAELNNNNRSRSAKLRVAEKI